MIGQEVILKKCSDLQVFGDRNSSADSSSGYGGNFSSDQQIAQIETWLAEVIFILKKFTPYSDGYIDAIVSARKDFEKVDSYTVCNIANGILKNFSGNLKEGLLGNFSDEVTAENFDDFLAHAEDYIRQDKKMESGVIAGVVFEDTIKKICMKSGISIEGQKLDSLINALKAQNVIQKTKASRCRTAASVRTAATHADWEALDLGAVRDTVSLTRELLDEFLV